MIRLDAFVDENRTRLKMNRKFTEKKLNSIHVVRFESTDGEVIGEECEKKCCPRVCSKVYPSDFDSFVNSTITDTGLQNKI